MEKQTGKKRPATHTRILHVSKIIFEKNGVTKTTCADIAEEAGIARSTFFTHFASLDELYAELNQRELIDLIDKVKELSSQESSPEYILKELFAKLVDDTIKYPKTFVELLVKGLLFMPNKNKYFTEFERVVSKVAAGLLRQTPPTPEEAFTSLLGLYFGFIFKALLRDSNVTADDGRAVKAAIDRYIDSLKL
ncbi:MAG: TetR/AcrR family transcriptional regulator [Clostridiales bacterium]|jgi:TetR/AcrR family acrAB operon transcriptional repressor|nr:TetR/AcrR family transcriptional regulator [Clostridiales bacterium]